MEDIMLSVIIATYNHEKYIKETIQGILSQKTDFRYEILVHDDASTDGTADIIKEYEIKYPGVVRGFYETENQYQQGKISEKRHHLKKEGKYFAIIDGDDYWIDDEKIQKQIAFLEAHEEYSMCMSNAVKLNCMTGEETLLNTFPKEGTYSQEEQVKMGLGTNFPASSSYVYRSRYHKNMPGFIQDAESGDYAYRNYFACCGKVYYFEKPMVVYRVGNNQSMMSVWRKDRNAYCTYVLKMITFFEKFDDYTGKRFHDILERKIISDCLGFCAAIGRKEGLEMALKLGIDAGRLESCYKYVEEDYLNERIKELDKKSEHLFIYGTSRLGAVCRRQLDYAGIAYEGFVVSDGQTAPEVFEGKPVYYLSDVAANYEKPGFILGIQPINVQEVTAILDKLNLREYCTVYAV